MASDSETASPSGIMASRSMTEPFEHRAATSCVVACLAPSLAGRGHFGVIQRIRFMFTDSYRVCSEAQGAQDFTTIWSGADKAPCAISPLVHGTEVIREACHFSSHFWASRWKDCARSLREGGAEMAGPKKA